MSCNRDGRQCQKAGDAVGGGDTELVQMTGRRSGGNCPTCGQFLPADVGTHTCPTVSTESSTIEAALNQAIANDERRPFIVVDGMDKYFPMMGGQSLESQVAELQRVTRDGGVAALYHYDRNSHKANDPRKPVAIFNDGRPAMVTGEAREAVDNVGWQNLSQAFHGLTDALDQHSEVLIKTNGQFNDRFKAIVDTPDAHLGISLNKEMTVDLIRVAEDVYQIKDLRTITASDFEGIQASYLNALDRRIETQAGPAMAAVYRELGQDYWEEGYTENEVNDGCAKLNEVARNVFGLPGEVAVMWNNNDAWSGFGGDSELVYIKEVPGDPDKPDWGGEVETYSLSSPFLADSDPNDFINDLRRIARREAEPDAVYPGDEVTYDGHNWGPWQADEEEEGEDEWDDDDDGGFGGDDE